MTMFRFPDKVPVVGKQLRVARVSMVCRPRWQLGNPKILMVQVVFTPNLQRHVHCPPVRVTGSTVAEVLNGVFDDNPILKGYVLDDQGALRKNMVIFVDGRALKDRCTLNDRVTDDAEIFVMQALTGG
jgi:molybdopterin synthase sulfur carrier subunit